MTKKTWDLYAPIVMLALTVPVAWIGMLIACKVMKKQASLLK